MAEPTGVVGQRVALRRCVLAVSVLDGVDALPDDAGVTLAGEPPLHIAWDELVAAVADLEPDGAAARALVGTWLRHRRHLADLPDPAGAARPVGLPTGHQLHPGPSWVRSTVLGGALDLGIGFLGLLDDPDEVVVVDDRLARAAGLPVDAWWPRCLAYVDQMGLTAAVRHLEDPTAPLRPIGDCDVVTLLAAPVFRAALCSSDSTGLRTAAVPMRRRGWLDLGGIDPAFASAAAAATPAAERGFDRAVLVTADEVVLAPAGGQPAEIVLRDPLPTAQPWLRF